MKLFALYTSRPPVTALKFKKNRREIQNSYSEVESIKPKGWTSDTEQNTQNIILSQTFHWSYHRTYNRGN